MRNSSPLQAVPDPFASQRQWAAVSTVRHPISVQIVAHRLPRIGKELHPASVKAALCLGVPGSEKPFALFSVGGAVARHAIMGEVVVLPPIVPVGIQVAACGPAWRRKVSHSESEPGCPRIPSSFKWEPGVSRFPWPEVAESKPRWQSKTIEQLGSWNTSYDLWVSHRRSSLRKKRWRRPWKR